VHSKAKKTLFIAVANLFGIGILLGAAEFSVRWRAEHGFTPAWRSLFTASSPFSELGTGNVLIADPEIGYRFNPARAGINSLGIRNAEVDPRKTPGTTRLIVLGDSVSAPVDGYVSIVRDRLRARAEVINAGVPGYTTYQERRLLERYLLRLEPDLVILQYCLNDNHKFLHRFDAEERMLFTEEARRVLAPASGGGFAWLAHHSYLALRLRLALLGLQSRRGAYPWDDQPDVAVAWQEETWKPFEQHLTAMREEISSNGGRLMVLIAPYRPQYNPDLLARDRAYVLKPQKLMESICAAEGVPLLDLYPVLGRHGGPTLFIDNYHFNPAGHRLVAASLLEFLQQEKMIAIH
jgi:lysophospholipase L1-like esterase